MSAPLPSAREAMRQAIERAQLGDLEGGRLWLDIARELRAGETLAWPFPRPLDSREGPPEVVVPLPDENNFDTAVIVLPPVARHAEHEDRLAQTVVLGYDPAGEAAPNRCGNCPHEIELDTDGGRPIWRHSMTRQAVCPVNSPDQTHTFATPLVDARG